MIKAILWDYGNVLVRWSPRAFYSTVIKDTEKLEFFLENVCPMSWHHLHDMGQSMFETIPARQKEFPEFSAEIAMWYDNFKDMLLGEISQSVALLKSAHAQKVPQFMITNMPSEVKGVCFDGYEFLDCFEEIIVSGDEKLAKPEPEIFHLCLKRMGNIPAENVLFIDDSIANIKAASQMGFETHLFSDPEELVKTFEKLGILNAN